MISRIVLALAMLAAALHAAAVVPDPPKPRPAAPPVQKAAPAPVDPMKEILARFDMAGEWTVEGQRRDRSVLRGILKVAAQPGSPSYRGSLTWSSHATGFAVRQDAVISVSGESVRVDCSNPEVVNGSGAYTADRFELKIVEPKILRGTARDARGAQGNILMIKK